MLHYHIVSSEDCGKVYMIEDIYTQRSLTNSNNKEQQKDLQLNKTIIGDGGNDNSDCCSNNRQNIEPTNKYNLKTDYILNWIQSTQEKARTVSSETQHFNKNVYWPKPDSSSDTYTMRKTISNKNSSFCLQTYSCENDISYVLQKSTLPNLSSTHCEHLLSDVFNGSCAGTYTVINQDNNTISQELNNYDQTMYTQTTDLNAFKSSTSLQKKHDISDDTFSISLSEVQKNQQSSNSNYLACGEKWKSTHKDNTFTVNDSLKTYDLLEETTKQFSNSKNSDIKNTYTASCEIVSKTPCMMGREFLEYPFKNKPIIDIQKRREDENVSEVDAHKIKRKDAYAHFLSNNESTLESANSCQNDKCQKSDKNFISSFARKSIQNSIECSVDSCTDKSFPSHCNYSSKLFKNSLKERSAHKLREADRKVNQHAFFDTHDDATYSLNHSCIKSSSYDRHIINQKMPPKMNTQASIDITKADNLQHTGNKFGPTAKIHSRSNKPQASKERNKAFKRQTKKESNRVSKRNLPKKSSSNVVLHPTSMDPSSSKTFRLFNQNYSQKKSPRNVSSCNKKQKQDLECKHSVNGIYASDKDSFSNSAHRVCDTTSHLVDSSNSSEFVTFYPKSRRSSHKSSPTNVSCQTHCGQSKRQAKSSTSLVSKSNFPPTRKEKEAVLKPHNDDHRLCTVTEPTLKRRRKKCSRSEKKRRPIRRQKSKSESPEMNSCLKPKHYINDFCSSESDHSIKPSISQSTVISTQMTSLSVHKPEKSISSNQRDGNSGHDVSRCITWIDKFREHKSRLIGGVKNCERNLTFLCYSNDPLKYETSSTKFKRVRCLKKISKIAAFSCFFIIIFHSLLSFCVNKQTFLTVAKTNKTSRVVVNTKETGVKYDNQKTMNKTEDKTSKIDKIKKVKYKDRRHEVDSNKDLK